VKVLVYPHELAIGGCPINAVDLAASIVEQGHEAIVYGIPGPLNDYIAAKGLRFMPAQALQYRPAPTRVAQLARLARAEGIDLIHAYEWPPCLDAYFGAHLVGGVPLVCTVLSMALVPLIPESIPLVMGTRQLAEDAQQRRAGRVDLIEPPIDSDHDSPLVDGIEFRRRHGIAPDEILVVVVSRLAVDLKLDSLVRAIDAVADLAGRLPVRLVMAGTGDAADQLSSRARSANAALGREVIKLPGPTLDPRPAYAAADVVLGMGSSALRGMAFAKAVVVQGEEGFSSVFDPSTSDLFFHQGFYGIGDGRPGCELLSSQIESLVADPGLREDLGRFGRQVVVDRYSLHSASTTLLKIYQETLDDPVGPRRPRLSEAGRMVSRAIANEVRLHDPAKKRARRAREAAKLSAAAAS
jgi:L-malate glycosyltransferase